MKKTLLLILSMFLIVGIADAKHKKKKKSIQIVTANTLGIQSISMHRTACFGKCPDYIIEIDNNGLIKYTGIHFVDDTGKQEKNIGAKAAKEIIDEFIAYRIDTCSEVYQNRIPDLPGIQYIIKYSNKTQKISNAHFGPAFLKEMAKKMDAVWNETKTK